MIFSEELDYMIIFFSSLMLTLLVTPYLINFLERNGVVDKPDKRRVNKKITPRMGGVVIFMIVLVQVILFYQDLNAVRFLLLGSVIIAICGMLDDIASLRWYVKFAAQFVTAAVIIYSIKDSFKGIEFFGLYIPSGLDYLLLFFFIIGVINSINLMDGLDGLVSGYSLAIFLIIITLNVIQQDFFILLLSAALIGSLLGFLKFNAFPARIFLGDTGALLLGYFLVVGSIYTSIHYSHVRLDLTFPTLLLAVPIVDTIKVILIRLFYGKHPFLPDKSHLHHVLFGHNVTHKSTVFIIHGFNLLFISLALMYLENKEGLAVTILFLVLVILLFNLKQIIKYLKNSEYFNSLYYEVLKVYSLAVRLNKKYLLYLSSILAISIIFFSFPKQLPLNREALFFLAGVGIFLFFISLFQSREADIKNHIYVYFNMAIFFLLYNLQHLKSNLETRFYSIDVALFTRISFIILATIVILLLIVRPKILPKERIFLSGMDLIIIILIPLSLVLQYFINNKFLEIVSSSLKMSLVLYLWYRIVVELNKNIRVYLYYSTFGLSICSVLYLIFIT